MTTIPKKYASPGVYKVTVETPDGHIDQFGIDVTNTPADLVDVSYDVNEHGAGQVVVMVQGRTAEIDPGTGIWRKVLR